VLLTALGSAGLARQRLIKKWQISIAKMRAIVTSALSVISNNIIARSQFSEGANLGDRQLWRCCEALTRRLGRILGQCPVSLPLDENFSAEELLAPTVVSAVQVRARSARLLGSVDGAISVRRVLADECPCGH
jgi:hypothetical protein